MSEAYVAYIYPMDEEVKQLVLVRDQFLKDGHFMVEQGRAKLESAKRLDAIIKAIDPSFNDPNEIRSGKQLSIPSTKILSNQIKPRTTGWTNFLEDNLKAGPKSMDELMELANKRLEWSGVQKIRMRLRVTIHALAKRGMVGIDKESNKWKWI